MLENKVKQDLFELYKIINKMASSKDAQLIFNKDILELAKTPIKEVENILYKKNNEKKKIVIQEKKY